MSIVTRNSRSRVKSRLARLAMEHLEEREVLTTTLDLNPATAAPKIFTFADATGDVITIRLQGSSGSAIITSDDAANVNAGTLEDGEDIVSISIVNPSPNFSISFAVDTGAGDGVIALGAITANRTIRGIFTVADHTNATPGDFQLSSFVGPGFSNGGGIGVTNIIGNGAGVALNTSLQAKQVINVLGSVTGSVTLANGLGGSLNIGGDVVSGVWNVNGDLKNTGTVTVGGNFNPNFNVSGLTSGSINIGDDAVGRFKFNQDVLARARLTANSWTEVVAVRAFGGAITATTGAIDLTVGTNLLGTAKLSAQTDIDLAVTGSVLSGAKIAAGGDVDAIVGRDFSGRITTDGSTTLSVGGSVVGGRINADNDIDLTVQGSVVAKSLIQSEDQLTAVIRGSIADSTFDATTGGISMSVSGAVTNAKIFSGSDGLTVTTGGSVVNSSIQSTSADSTVTIGGSLVNSRLTNGSSDLSVSVAGNVVNSRLSSLESDVSLSVGGSVSTTRITGERVTLDINGAMTGSHVDAQLLITADIGGNLVDTVMAAITTLTDSIILNLGGDMIKSHLTSDEIILDAAKNVIDSVVFASSRNLSAAVGGSITGSSLTATDREVILTVAGSVTNSEIEAGSIVSASIGGNLVTSKIYGDEGGEPVTLTVAGDVISSLVVAGDGDITATVGGNVRDSKFSASSNITLTVGKSMTDSSVNAGSDTTVTIGGSMARSAIAADNDIDLTVGGSVSDSDLSSSDSGIVAVVGGSVINTAIQGSTDIEVTVGGSISNTDIISAESDVTVTVGGSFTSGSVQASGDALLKAGVDFGASVDAENLDLNVGRDLLESAILQVENVQDGNADDVAFRVGRDFNGELSVTTSFTNGLPGSSATLVGRDVGLNAKLNINSINSAGSADEFVFGGFVRGEINLWGDLATDIHVVKDLAQMSIQGAVLADIIVGGKVQSLTTGSLFDQTSATTGDFEDQLGTVTGTLTAGSIGDVDPRV